MIKIYLKKPTILFAILLCYFLAAGQNMVPNGDFENYISLPNSTADWHRCVGWNNVNMSMSNWPYSTPDYFHTSGTGDANLPNSKYAYVQPQSGNAIMGMIVRHGSQSNAREYIATQLSSPMVVGQNYTISFWVTSGQSSHYYGNSCNHLGIQLSTAPLTQTNHEVVAGTPHVEIITEVWTTGWQFYTFNYTATEAFEYMTFGNFYNDFLTSYSFQVSATYTNAYYFVDDFQIVPGPPLGMNLATFQVEKDMDRAKLDWQVAANNTYKYFAIERSKDNSDWEEFDRVEKNVNPNSTNQYSVYDNFPYSGTSYYRLRSVDKDGTVEYSDTKVVSFENTGSKPYPNPVGHGASLFVKVNTEGGFVKIQLIDMTGKIAEEKDYYVESGSSTLELSTEALPICSYIYKISTKERQDVGKVVITR